MFTNDKANINIFRIKEFCCITTSNSTRISMSRELRKLTGIAIQNYTTALATLVKADK
jgi:hypothetical protein